MSVGTWEQPDFETQSGTVYKTNLDNCIAVAERLARAFAPHEQSTPNMTVRLDAGQIWDGSSLTEVAAQSTGTITAPSANPRIDRIVVDVGTGAVSVVTGAEAASPVAPNIPAGKMPVAQVYLTTATTEITNSDITDERVLGGAGGATESEQEVFTSNGNFTAKKTGPHRIRAVGGGGGGGGGAGGTLANTSGGGGGGGGQFVEGVVNLTKDDVVPVVIGTAGVGGVGGTGGNPGADGTDGGDTTFGSHLTADKGKKGTGGQRPTAGIGGQGGKIRPSTATQKYANFEAGGDGLNGESYPAVTDADGGDGGDAGNQYGIKGLGALTSSVPGDNATGYGGGGGGGHGSNTTGTNGGNATPGYLVVDY